MFINLHGHLPMLASKSIKTWLVLSNDNPSIMENKTVNFKLSITIYDNKGKKIKALTKFIAPKEYYKVCLNNYLDLIDNELKTYYVKLSRSATEKGFRGSTRTHFFYEAKKSMATLHTQYGEQKINSIKLVTSKNKNKNFIFMINPHNKFAFIKSKIYSAINELSKKEILQDNIKLTPKGSKLFELNNIDPHYKDHFFESKASIPIKCYFIIADNKLENLSVDHI